MNPPASPAIFDVPLERLLEPGTSLGCALAGVAVMLLLMLYANKRYNITNGGLALTGLFLGLCGVCWWTYLHFTAGLVLGIVNLLNLCMLFGSLGHERAVAPVFLSATFLGWGSMLNVGGAWFAVLYLPLLAMLKELRFRELCAYLLGLLTPYWILFGFGALRLESLMLPDIEPIYLLGRQGIDVPEAILAGIVVVAGFFSAAVTLLKYLNTNLRRRQISQTFALFWAGCSVLMFFDFNNFNAYLPTLLATTAFQTALNISNAKDSY